MEGVTNDAAFAVFQTPRVNTLFERMGRLSGSCTGNKNGRNLTPEDFARWAEVSGTESNLAHDLKLLERY